MAQVELTGETGSGTEGYADISSLKFAPVVSDLLPYGLAWDREDPTLQELIKAEARELGRADRRARDLTRELDPSKTYELLTDWETAYGLPECPGTDNSIEARRAALVAKLLAQAGHEQSLLYWTAIFEQFGYLLEYVDLGFEILTCIDDCQDPLCEEPFVWFAATSSGDKDDVLECFVEKNAPLYSYPIVHWLWTEAGTVPAVGDLKGIASNSKGYSAAGGAGGATVYSTDDTDTWTAGTVLGFDIYAVCAVDDVFVGVGAVGLNSAVSSDGGATWVSVDSLPDPLYGVSRGPDADGVVVAVGANGVIYRSAGYGLSWAPVASPTAQDLFAVGYGDGVMVAVGDSGTVIRSTNAGSSWSVIAAFTALTLGAVAGFGSTFVATSSGGAIFRSGDGGLTWDTIPPVTTEVLRGVSRSWTGRWTAVGDAGTILLSKDDGVTWEVQDSPTTEDLYAVCPHYPDGRTLVCGDNSMIVRE